MPFDRNFDEDEDLPEALRPREVREAPNQGFDLEDIDFLPQNEARPVPNDLQGLFNRLAIEEEEEEEGQEDPVPEEEDPQPEGEEYDLIPDEEVPGLYIRVPRNRQQPQIIPAAYLDELEAEERGEDPRENEWFARQREAREQGLPDPAEQLPINWEEILRPLLFNTEEDGIFNIGDEEAFIIRGNYNPEEEQ